MKKKPPPEAPPRRRHDHGVIHQLLMSLLRTSGRYDMGGPDKTGLSILMRESSALSD